MLKAPELGFSNELNIEIKVVFPAPLGPNKPKISPRVMVKFKSDTEKKSAPLYFFESRSI